MKIGLIDVDHYTSLDNCFPNLPLMKLSAWHKQQGDFVRWYDAWDGFMEKYDRVYMSKVFTFTEDYESPVYADEIHRGVRVLHLSCGWQRGVRPYKGYTVAI